MLPDGASAISEVAAGRWDQVPWILLIGSFVLSMLGALCGSYIKRKGENQATREDFADLLEQLKKTTHATEEIKSTLSSKSWLSQQQWVIRERHYVELLKHITLLRNSLRDQGSYFREPGSEHQEKTISALPHFKQLSQ